MQRSWESGTGGLRSGTEMVGVVFLSRPRPYMRCSVWESVSQSNHKLSKHFYLEKMHSVVQQLMISQTDFTVIICINIVDNFMLFAPCTLLYSHLASLYYTSKIELKKSERVCVYVQIILCA